MAGQWRDEAGQWAGKAGWWAGWCGRMSRGGLLTQAGIFHKKMFIPQTRLNLVCGISLFCKNNGPITPLFIFTNGIIALPWTPLMACGRQPRFFFTWNILPEITGTLAYLLRVFKSYGKSPSENKNGYNRLKPASNQGGGTWAKVTSVMVGRSPGRPLKFFFGGNFLGPRRAFQVQLNTLIPLDMCSWAVLRT